MLPQRSACIIYGPAYVTWLSVSTCDEIKVVILTIVLGLVADLYVRAIPTVSNLTKFFFCSPSCVAAVELQKTQSEERANKFKQLVVKTKKELSDSQKQVSQVVHREGPYINIVWYGGHTMNALNFIVLTFGWGAGSSQ